MRTSATAAIRGIAILSTAAMLLVGCTTTTVVRKSAKPLVLTIGALLPNTGAFSSLASAENAGITLAADDINQASLGITVKVDYVDSGDATTDTAATSIKDLISKHATAIVGPTSNDVTRKVLPQATSAGLVMISPQNSSPQFTTADDNGLYFRTSPSDDAEGTTLGKLIAKEGHSKLAIMLLTDDYGIGMQKSIATSFTGAGGSVVSQQTFGPTETDLSKQVAAVVKAKPDAVALVTQTQATSLAPALIAAGIPASALYFTDRNLVQYGATIPVSLKGAHGVAAGPVLDEFFKKKVLTLNPTLTGFAYAPESYDAVVLIALASLAAQSTEGAKIAAKLRAVSGGTGRGEKATDYASAAQIILAGDPVDYDGYSGGIAFDAHGDPTQAVIGTYRYGADNLFTRLQ